MDKKLRDELYTAFRAGFLISLLRPSMGHILTSPNQLEGDFENFLKAREPKKQLYICLRCMEPRAEKQKDVCGWDGYCSKCGIIAQSEVGESVDIRDEVDELRDFLKVSGVLK